MHFGEFGVLPVSKNSTCQVTSCVTQPSAMAAFTAALVEAELQVSLNMPRTRSRTDSYKTKPLDEAASLFLACCDLLKIGHARHQPGPVQLNVVQASWALHTYSTPLPPVVAAYMCFCLVTRPPFLRGF